MALQDKNQWLASEALAYCFRRGHRERKQKIAKGESLVELLSKRLVHKTKPQPVIQNDGCIQVSLANDSVTTLDEYVVIPINVEGVEAVMKAWLVDDEVYDLLLGLG